MGGKDLVKYGVAFSGGVLAVVGVMGAIALTQGAASQTSTSSESPSNPAPSPQSSELAREQISADPADSAQPLQDEVARQSTHEAKPSPAASESTNSAPEQVAKESVSNVTPIDSLVRNSAVIILGTVERVTDEDEFILRDETGTVQVYTGKTFFTVETGQLVTVHGRVDDARQLEIYADQIVLPSGESLSIRHWD